jgi:hypothetical protein
MNAPATERPNTSGIEVNSFRVEETRVVEARGFRVEAGALVLVQPLGCAAAYAPSTWLTIEAHDTEG